MKLLSTYITNIKSVGSVILEASRTAYFEIIDSNFTLISTGIIDVLLTKLYIERCNFNASHLTYEEDSEERSRALSLARSDVYVMRANFVNFMSLIEGGAILSRNTNLTLNFTIFEKNKAKEGAGLYLYCA